MPKSIFTLITILFLFSGSIILGGCAVPGPAPDIPSGDSETESSRAKNSYCMQYADRTLQQINERIERTGSAPANDPEWSKDWDHYYSWCLQMPESLSKYRADQRQGWLDSHSGSSSTNSNNAFCRQYADRALQQRKERIEQTGSAPTNDPVWSKDWNQHYNWCAQVPKSLAKNGSKQRQDWLDSHSAGNPVNSKEAFCREYTKNALRQIQIRKRMGSRAPSVMPAPNDPVWKEDFNHHYNWCLGAPESRANQGSKMRQDWLDQHRKQ